MNRLLLLLALLFFGLGRTTPAVGVRATGVGRQDERPALESATLGTTRNVHRLDSLWFGGQFDLADLEAIQQAGIRTIVTLRTEGELDWDEQAAVEAAGLTYHELPFRAPETLTDELFGRLREWLRTREEPALLHCGSANRVGAAWLPYRVLDQGVPLELALQEAKAIGLRSPALEARALDYVRRQGKSVKPGINDRFKDPELDVSQYLQRFEVESREVYASRAAVLSALGVAPGNVVADIGAGTGLFTFPLAERVGPSGWVFAVDIAPRFLQRIHGLADERGVENVTTLLCSERSTGLPPNSIDVAFVCDTYHHFEYPVATMASLVRALRPGGRLFLLDFERIEGVTREWLLEHVRAGKDTFRAEVEAAGLRFSREVEVEGLVENYLLEFVKPRD